MFLMGGTCCVVAILSLCRYTFAAGRMLTFPPSVHQEGMVSGDSCVRLEWKGETTISVWTSR